MADNGSRAIDWLAAQGAKFLTRALQKDQPGQKVLAPPRPLTGPAPRMELLGYLLRAGADLRYRLSDRATGVLHAQLAFGTLHDEGASVSIVGPRLGALIEWAR